jgi:hypothetical protein
MSTSIFADSDLDERDATAAAMVSEGYRGTSTNSGVTGLRPRDSLSRPEQSSPDRSEFLKLEEAVTDRNASCGPVGAALPSVTGGSQEHTRVRGDQDPQRSMQSPTVVVM